MNSIIYIPMGHTLESFLSSLDPAEDCLHPGCLDGEPLDTSNGTPTVRKSSSQGLQTVSSMMPPYLARSISSKRRVTGKLTPVKSMLSALASPDPASRFHSLDCDSQTTTRETDGLPPSGSFAWYDRDTSCWRTFQVSLLTGITEPYLENFPRQGMMRAGVCYQRPVWERRTSGTGSGLLPAPKVSRGGYQVSHGKQVPTLEGIVKFPTPTANDQRQRFNSSLSAGAARRPNLAAMARFDLWPTPTVGDATGGRTTSKGKDHPTSLNMAVKYATPQARDHRTGSSKRWQEARKGIRSCNLNDQLDGALNPDWVEWLMGWPVGWTSLDPLPAENYEDWKSKILTGTWWAIEPDIPRVAVGVKDRTNRIMALGNGQVPAVVVKAWRKGAKKYESAH